MSKIKKLHFRRGLSTKFHYKFPSHLHSDFNGKSLKKSLVDTKRGTSEALKTENMLAVNAIPCDRGMVV